MDKKEKLVVDASYLRKSPEIKLNTGFSSLERFSVINEYDDGSSSDSYNCDIVVRRGFDAVGIIPYLYIDNKLHILLLNNFRAAAFFREKILGNTDSSLVDENTKSMIEIPAGILEKDELKLTKNDLGIRRCAARELMEETGYELSSREMKVLGSFYYSSPGLLTEKIYIATCDITGLLAEKIVTDGSVMEETIKPFIIPFSEALALCNNGVIRNAVTEIAIKRLYFLLLVEKDKSHSKILQKRLDTMSREIRSLKREANYYNKLIREFRATITHELKHPFTQVMGYISLLKNKNTSEEDRAKWIDVISRSVSQLYELNKNLVKTALQDDDHMQNTEAFNTYDNINEIVEGYKYLYDSSLETNISIDESSAVLIGNPYRLKLIMEGIISNAFKFTKNGSINITVRLIDTLLEPNSLDFSPDLFNYHVMTNVLPNEIEISVKDSGIGIKPKQLKKIFIPFYQSDSRFSREFSGVGLGLSVVKDLVHTMQGSIKIDSEINVGTLVCLRIPFGIPESN